MQVTVLPDWVQFDGSAAGAALAIPAGITAVASARRPADPDKRAGRPRLHAAQKEPICTVGTGSSKIGEAEQPSRRIFRPIGACGNAGCDRRIRAWMLR